MSANRPASVERQQIAHGSQEIGCFKLDLAERHGQRQVPGRLELRPASAVLVELWMELLAVALDEQSANPQVDATDATPATVEDRDLALDVDDPIAAEDLYGSRLEPALRRQGVWRPTGERRP